MTRVVPGRELFSVARAVGSSLAPTGEVYAGGVQRRGHEALAEAQGRGYGIHGL